MPSKNAADWLKGKTLEELDAIEFGGRLLFPDKILRAKKDGTFEETPVVVRVPRESEIGEARVEAVRMFKARGLDRTEDADLFEELDMLCRLARAIREVKPPHGQFMPTEMLIGKTDPKTGHNTGYDQTALHDVWGRIQVYREMTDPRVTEWSADDVLRAADAIAQTRNCGPLAAIAGSELDSFVIAMASILSTYRTQLRSSLSPAISTVET